jgi:hypothetical protein
MKTADRKSVLPQTKPLEQKRSKQLPSPKRAEKEGKFQKMAGTDKLKPSNLTKEDSGAQVDQRRQPRKEPEHKKSTEENLRVSPTSRVRSKPEPESSKALRSLRSKGPAPESEEESKKPKDDLKEKRAKSPRRRLGTKLGLETPSEPTLNKA